MFGIILSLIFGPIIILLSMVLLGVIWDMDWNFILIGSLVGISVLFLMIAIANRSYRYGHCWRLHSGTDRNPPSFS